MELWLTVTPQALSRTWAQTWRSQDTSGASFRRSLSFSTGMVTSPGAEAWVPVKPTGPQDSRGEKQTELCDMEVREVRG